MLGSIIIYFIMIVFYLNAFSPATYGFNKIYTIMLEVLCVRENPFVITPNTIIVTVMNRIGRCKIFVMVRVVMAIQFTFTATASQARPNNRTIFSHKWHGPK